MFVSVAGHLRKCPRAVTWSQGDEVFAQTKMLLGVGGPKGRRVFKTVEHRAYSYIIRLGEMPEANAPQRVM
jgi:hypothetical protein